MAATNPIYVDRDCDGAYTSPRESARGQLRQARSAGLPLNDPAVLEGLDEGMSLQCLDLLREERGITAMIEVGSIRARGSGRITALLRVPRDLRP